jgi:hypothetical protein
LKTVTENLQEFANDIRNQLEDLVRHHSGLYVSNPPDSGIYVVNGDHRWKPLAADGRRIQAKVLEDYRKFIAIVEALIRHLPSKTLKVFNESNKKILSVIQQDGNLRAHHPEEPLAKAIQALEKQVNLLFDLYAADEVPVLVPDTNALLYNPVLEAWQFSDFSCFTIMLTPTVLSELDRLKVEHKKVDIQKRADKLIRQIKEYRRRGLLTDGVPLVKNVSRIRALAVEPKTAEAFPWLDPHNNDDRILASMLEIMRQYPRSPVVLVTRDINLQNKAEFARVVFIEPPEPKNPGSGSN